MDVFAHQLFSFRTPHDEWPDREDVAIKMRKQVRSSTRKKDEMFSCDSAVMLLDAANFAAGPIPHITESSPLIFSPIAPQRDGKNTFLTEG